MSSFHEWRPDFKLAPSRSAALFISASHVISLLAIIGVVISYQSLVLVGLCVAIAVMCSWLASLTSLGFFQKNGFQKSRSPNRNRRICAVSQEPSGEWKLHLADGSVQLCLLSKASVVSRFAIFLSFKPVAGSRRFVPLLTPFRTRSLLVTADSVSAQTYRHLHVWLRWQSGELLGLSEGRKGKGARVR